jgi:PHD/YefM family antitoxin component YafN of YafNO toxin-antitoxin module
MTVTLKSTEAQQNFGAMLDRAIGEDDVIVERYGSPRVAIVNYRRYQALVAAEKELIRLRLQQASAAVSARAADLDDTDLDNLIQEARTEASNARKQ